MFARQVIFIFLVAITVQLQAAVPIDLSRYRADSGIDVQQQGQRLVLQWNVAAEERGRLTLNLTNDRPLIESIALTSRDESAVKTLLQDVDPITFVTVGSRQGSRTKGWVAFFDKVHRRPFATHVAQLDLNSVRVTSHGQRTTVTLSDLRAGPFQGELCVTIYAGARLIHVEAVVSTELDRLAILYDAGLVTRSPSCEQMAWMDTTGQLQSQLVEALAPARPVAVRHRALMAEGSEGTLALFPPPHQFFYPLDISTNLRFTWFGKGFHDKTDQFGFGIRQHPDGDNRFVPWFNAPPGTKQRLGVFYLLSGGRAEDALQEVQRYTHGDRFPALPGHLTFTSHYHLAHTMDVMRRRVEGRDTSFVPDFVSMMKDMGVNIVHMGEFHGDGDPRDAGPKRLPQLELMYRECDRLSDDGFLLLPGEEPNVHFGGHWMNLFPRPVYWIMNRQTGKPFVEKDSYYGTIYRIGDADELLEMLRREHGLAWTAHARIKSSHGYPDKHRDSRFYLSNHWLGAAWKAMPADLSRAKLGERVLDLQSDMANWGQKKYVIGEVDVFKIDPTHELYGHMNINYVRLDALPKFADGWRPLLDALSGGRFFVSTGEVLIPEFEIDGRKSGETLQLTLDRKSELTVRLVWTFPLNFAEIVSGDGEKVYRQRIDLSDTLAFGNRLLRQRLDLTGRKWVRFEVWDVAANGAFTHPVWLECQH